MGIIILNKVVLSYNMVFYGSARQVSHNLQHNANPCFHTFQSHISLISLFHKQTKQPFQPHTHPRLPTSYPPPQRHSLPRDTKPPRHIIRTIRHTGPILGLVEQAVEMGVLGKFAALIEAILFGEDFAGEGGGGGVLEGC